MFMIRIRFKLLNYLEFSRFSLIMFKRKLEALNFYSVDTFNCDSKLRLRYLLIIYLLIFCMLKDEIEFRNFISWLENQKIRSYRIEDRAALDDINNPNWQTAFNSVDIS